MRVIALSLITLALACGVACAQDSIPVRVVRQLNDSTYLVQIRGRTMLAISEAVARRSLEADAELRGALAQLKTQDTLVAAYERALAWSDTTVRRQKLLISQLDSLYHGWRDVAGGWKRLAGEPWLTFDFGLGETGRDHNPAVLAGIGIRRFRIWGFLQE